MRWFVAFAIAVVSVSALALPNPVYNVRDYGATGDGVTDDTLAIRAAAAALQNAALPAGLGGKLYFPPGKYLIFSPGIAGGSLAVFQSLNGINVIADGATLKINRTFAPNETGVVFGFYYCSNITVDGFSVTGPPMEHGVTHGLNFVVLYQGNRNATLPNNKVSGVLAGLNCARESLTLPKSYNVIVGTMDVYDSIYGLTTGNGCDDLVVHALTTKNVTRSYVAYGVKNHTVTLTSYGASADDVALGSWLENVRLSYTSPAEYMHTIGSVGEHARVRVSFDNMSSYIRNLDIRLNVTYDGTTLGGPAVRLLKYFNVPQTLENLRISGYIKGKPNPPPLGDTNGPIIGMDETRGNWSGTNDTLRNIHLSDLRIENSKPVRFQLGGLKGPFLIQNVHSDNAIQLVEPSTGRIPENGRYAVVNSEFPNRGAYYPNEGAEPLDPINAPANWNIPVGWQGHTITSRWVGGVVTYTLPQAKAGLDYSIIAANALVYVRPQPADSIRGGPPGYALYLDSVGDGAKFLCVQDGVWEIVSSNGALSWSP